VIGVGTKGVKGLLEADFDFKAIAVKGDDLEWVNGDIASHKDHATAEGVVDENESYAPSDGTPEEIYRVIAEHDIVVSIERARGVAEAVLLGPQVSEAHFFTIEPRPARSPRGRLRGGLVGDGVGFHTSKEVVAFFQERQNDLPAGVEGIGDQEDSSLQDLRDRQKQCDELVQEASLIPVGKDQPLVDATGEGDGKKLA
jgi:hypothetical protein